MSLEKLISTFKEQKAVFVKKASTEFLKELKKLAKDAEGLEAIRWRQYTPYFNDGEACTFSVTDASFKLAGASEDAGDYEDGFQDSWSINYDKKTKHPATKQLEVINKLINDSAMEEILLDLYGDHVEITFNVETGKVTVEEYEHD